MQADPGSNDRVAPVWPLYLCLVAAICIAAAGYFHFDARQKDLARDKQNDLSAIAQLKVNEISMWYKERMADAQSIQGNFWAIEHMERWFAVSGESGRSSGQNAGLDGVSPERLFL